MHARRQSRSSRPRRRDEKLARLRRLEAGFAGNRRGLIDPVGGRPTGSGADRRGQGETRNRGQTDGVRAKHATARPEFWYDVGAIVLSLRGDGASQKSGVSRRRKGQSGGAEQRRGTSVTLGLRGGDLTRHQLCAYAFRRKLLRVADPVGLRCYLAVCRFWPSFPPPVRYRLPWPWHAERGVGRTGGVVGAILE